MGLPSLPGQELEKAVAEVGSAAGKSLVGGLDRLFQSWIARRASRNEALAEETKRDIAHQGERRRQEDLTGDRRQQELAEVEHQYELRNRVAGRLLAQWEAEQRAVEWVASRAVLITEGDPDREQERDLDDDWLRRFFKYVAEVDEEQVLEILAQALADAAIRTKPLISARALDTLRFFEQDTLAMFRYCATKVGLFGMVPQHFVDVLANMNGLALDLSLMIEMGLVKIERRQTLTFPIGDLHLSFSTGPGGHYDIEAVKLAINGLSLGSINPASELHSVNGLGINGVITKGQAFIDAIGVEREDAQRDPFLLGRLIGTNLLDEDNQALVSVFVAAFDDFDKHTLPAIVGANEPLGSRQNF